jgi:hypothetical protein
MALQSVVALATITLQSPSTSVSFSSIPNIYRDLFITVSANTTSSFDPISMVFNGDTASTRTALQMSGNGSSPSSSTFNDLRLGDIYSTFNLPTFFVISIPEYRATDRHKIYTSRGNQSGNFVNAIAGQWFSTNAINAISFSGQYGGSFATGSVFSLYGRIA